MNYVSQILKKQTLQNLQEEMAKLLEQQVPGARIVEEENSGETQNKEDGKEFPPLPLEKKIMLTKQQKTRLELRNDLFKKDKKLEQIKKRVIQSKKIELKEFSQKRKTRKVQFKKKTKDGIFEDKIKKFYKPRFEGDLFLLLQPKLKNHQINKKACIDIPHYKTLWEKDHFQTTDDASIEKLISVGRIDITPTVVIQKLADTSYFDFSNLTKKSQADDYFLEANSFRLAV